MAKLPRTVVVDIDGTISNRWPQRDPYDLTKVIHDEPINTVIQVVYALECQGWQVCYLTARGEEARHGTKTWLGIYVGGLGDRPLFMRKKGDNRDDVTIKSEIYHDKIAPKYRVELALDDNPNVIEWWRDEGIQAFQVADGKF